MREKKLHKQFISTFPKAINFLAETISLYPLSSLLNFSKSINFLAEAISSHPLFSQLNFPEAILFLAETISSYPLSSTFQKQLIFLQKQFLRILPALASKANNQTF